MKLHLPKLLRVALLSVVCGVSATYAAETYPKVSQDGKYINVGLASKGNSPDNIVTWTKDDLIVSSGMKVGYFSNSWVLSQNHPVINGEPSTETLLAMKISNTLKINGTLTITGDGMVYLGGQCGGNRYTGLIAKEVIVGIAKDEKNGVEEVKATGTVQNGGVTTSGSTYNLSATLANIDKLTVNSGAVVFRPNQGTANFKQGDASPIEKGKISWIKDELSVTGGTLYMGHTQGAEPVKYTQHFLNGFGRSGDAAKICQSDGDVYIYGRTYIHSGMELSQTGGTMCIAMGSGKNVNASSLLVFSGTTKNVINQEKGTLTLGRIGADNWLSNYNGKVSLEINQTGDGKLYLTDGVLYTSKEGSESSIKQTGGGLVQLKGDFTSAVFNVEQSRGTLELSGSAKLRSNSATIEGSLDVSSEAVLRTTDLNLSKSSNITNEGIIVAGSSETGAAKEVLNVTDGGRLNLADGYGTQTTGAIGTVSMTGGALNVNGSVTLGSLSVTGGALNVLIGGANEQNGTLTFDSTAAFSMGSSSVVNLNFSEGYLESVTTESTTLSFTIATTTGTFTSGDLSAGVGMVGADTRIWSVDGMQLTVDASGKNAIVSGTLKKSTEVNINTSDEVDSTVSDIDSQTSVKMLITEDVVISSANTHTGGTEIGTDTKGVDVVLKNDKALGAGDVTTKGESSLISDTDAEGNTVKAELTKAVENTGSLTLGGIFKGGNFGTTNLGEAHINVNGEEGNNGFFREAGAGYLVVNNSTGAALTLEPGAYFETNGTLYSITTNGYACELDYSTYHINEENHEVAMSDILAAGGGGAPAVEMENGKLTADANVDTLTATGGTLVMRNATVDGSISGDTSVEVMQGSGNILKGRNDYTGYTYVDKSVKLTVGDADALGKSSVTLQSRSSLDMNHHALENDMLAGAANLYNAENYRGNLTTAAGQLFLLSDTSANKVTLTGSGGLKGCSISVNILEKAAGATGKVGDKQFSNTSTNLHINPNGTIILNDGTLLTVEGSATLGAGTRFELRGGDWQSGDVLLTTTKGINTMRAGQYASQGTVILPYGNGLYVVNGTQVTLTNIFNQNIADAMVQADWGIPTASRAFVHAVRGQRTNTGCIADGRGTAWAAVLGAYNDLDGGDINLKGAAVGADMKVGSRSSVGMAIGYLDGEVSPTGLSEVDQEGTYVALYGEHGLRKLSATSCLSADWVVAYGQTESKYKGMSWDQDSLQLNGRLSWNKQLSERLGLRVFGGLEYFTSDSDTVNGIKTGSIDNLRGELGVGVDYVALGAPVDEKSAGMGCKRLVLHGELRYFNDLDRENPVVEMDGLSGRGENPGRSGVGIDVGATYRINDRWSTSANYSYSTMDGSTEHRLNVGASYTF